MFKKNAVILFQGDSITDCGRDYQDINSLGEGYPKMINECLQKQFADYNLTVINKGISGNRVVDLKERWQKDCLDINADYLTILIGINDMWRRYDSSDPTSTSKYENGYDELITLAKEKNKDIKIIILEPFLLPTKEEYETWRQEDLNDKIMAARRIARKHNCLFIPLDGIFISSLYENSAEYYSDDGVHPTQQGHKLITEEWMKNIKRIID